MRTFLSRLLDLVLRGRRERRLSEEIQAHLDLLTDEHLARGLSPAEARLAARKDFGGVEQIKETYRDRRGLPLFDALSQDLRYSIRSLRRTPTFTAVSIITLVLAIGANAGIVNLLNALLIRELPVRDPSTLVQVAAVATPTNEPPLTFALFKELSERQQVFSSLMGWWGASVRDVDFGGTIMAGAVFGVTGNFFGELGVQPSFGRLLIDNDMSLSPPTTERVAVLGYRFWQRAAHADPAVIGRAIRIAGVPFTVVGVAPLGYTGLRVSIEPDVTIPLSAVPLIGGRTVESIATRSTQWIRVAGRLKPNTSLSQARAHLEAIWPSLKDATVPRDWTPSEQAQHAALRVAVTSLAHGDEPGLRTRFTQPLLIVLGIAGLVLLIAAVNLASLSLARAVSRGHEIATKLAIGATRWRVCRQLLVESLLISTAGGLGGAIVAAWASRALAALIFADQNVPTPFDPGPDATVLGMTFLLSAAVGVAFGLAPCWWVIRQHASRNLRVDARTVTGSGRTGQLLVGAQIALAIILVVHAGLLIRTLQTVRAVDTGLAPDDVSVSYTREVVGGYTDLDNDVYYPALIERLRAVPGVEYASGSLLKPGGGGGIITTIAPLGSLTGGTSVTGVTRTDVAPDFFAALGVPIREGRDFSWTDNSHTRKVAILSHSLASRLFEGRPAIGERIRMGAQPRFQDIEVIGVTADSRVYDPKQESLDAIYLPALQSPEEASYKCLVIRGRNVSFTELQRTVSALGHEYVTNTESFNYIVGRTLLRERLTAALAGFFGLLAIVLSAIGIYGLMSYTVAQRRRETGIRLALGERPSQVVGRVLRAALVLTVLATATGLGVGLITVNLSRSLLFGVAPRDPVTFGLAAITMALVAVVAAAIPARRLAHVDPLTALRED